MPFNSQQFAASFDKTLKALDKAEKFTKDTLRDLSRDLISVTHETQDIGFVNRTIQVLTPMNRRTAIIFFKAFSGFKWNDDEQSFTKKDKAGFDAVVKTAAVEMEDPHFNIWTWAEKNVEVEAKKFSLDDVKKFAERAIKKGEKEGISQTDLLKAFFEGGFKPESLIAMMEAMAK